MEMICKHLLGSLSDGLSRYMVAKAPFWDSSHPNHSYFYDIFSVYYLEFILRIVCRKMMIEESFQVTFVICPNPIPKRCDQTYRVFVCVCVYPTYIMLAM